MSSPKSKVVTFPISSHEKLIYFKTTQTTELVRHKTLRQSQGVKLPQVSSSSVWNMDFLIIDICLLGWPEILRSILAWLHKFFLVKGQLLQGEHAILSNEQVNMAVLCDEMDFIKCPQLSTAYFLCPILKILYSDSFLTLQESSFVYVYCICSRVKIYFTI